MATAFSKGLDYLTARSRSVAETTKYLLSKGYSPQETAQAVARLLELDYLNDRKTAAGWVEYTMRCKPRGRERLSRELRARGFEREVIAAALESLTDEAELELALQLLAPRPVQQWPATKLFRFLRYRGFAYGVIEAVKLRYEENKGDNSSF